MSYHVEAPRFGFKELPERILVREDGAYGASKEHGEPIIDHWYVPEQDAPQAALEARVDELCAENERLRERLKASDDGRMRQADNLIDKCHKIARLQTENAELRELVADLWEFGFSKNAGANSVKEWVRKTDELRARVYEALEVDE